ncbi:MAG: aromatic ring-hydroxylating dioxygenase subunit alpha [Pirellulales bacterium]
MGTKTLPGEYFSSPDIYQRETREIFRKKWICVGRESSIPHSGDYFLHEVDGENLILVRNHQSQVNCFYNVCRHRGTRMCEHPSGHFKKRIQCPYHAWAYDLQGELKAAPNMTEVDSFDVKDFSLQAVHCVVWQGFVLVNLDPDCKSFESSHSEIRSRFDDWGLENLAVAHQITYDLQANWKIIF